MTGALNGPSLPATGMYWSNASNWPSGVLPQTGDYVEIPRTWHLYFDVDTAVLREIEVNGVLEFSLNVSASLRVNWVFVRAGSIVSGSESNLTPKNLRHCIVLHGEAEGDSFAFSSFVEAGNKVVVVTGNLRMYGYPKMSVCILSKMPILMRLSYL